MKVYTMRDKVDSVRPSGHSVLRTSPFAHAEANPTPLFTFKLDDFIS